MHTLKRNTESKTRARVGRGGKRGKTSGKGHKGQNARAGSATRPQDRDYIKRVPKRRGYGKNRARTVHSTRKGFTTLSTADLQNIAETGLTIISASRLVRAGFVEKTGGQIPKIKILGNGDITSAVTITRGVALTEAAKSKIEKSGGTIS